MDAIPDPSERVVELEVDLELVHELAEDGGLDDLTDAWFERSDELLAAIDDLPVLTRSTLRERVATMIASRRATASPTHA